MAKVGYDDFLAKKEKGKIKKRRNPALETVLHVFLAIIIISGLFAGGWFLYNKMKPEPPEYPAIESVFIDDTVKVFDNSSLKWKKVTDSFKLKVDDLLITGGTLRTILDFQNKASIRVAPGTGIKYKQFTGKTLNLGLEQGRIWLETWDGNYSVDTFRGTVTMGPGTAQISVNKGKSVSIHCYQGPLLVTTSAEKNNELTLKSGQKIFINNKNQISSIAGIDKKKNDEWEKWNLAFSGKTLQVGQELPTYKASKKKKEIVIVFDSPEVNTVKPQRSVKRPDVTNSQRTSYPKARQNYNSYSRSAKAQPHLNSQPGAQNGGSMENTSGSTGPGYDGRMSSELENPPHFDAEGDSGGVPDRPDDIDSMFGEGTNEEYKDKAQDAAQKLSNDKINKNEKRVRTGPPGFGITEKPVSD